MKYLLDVKNIFEGKKIRMEAFEEIDTFYVFTTENISGYLPNVAGKDVLSVASSGEHYFNLLLNGANSVDLFDINYLAQFIINLKKITIENLDYEYYLLFFGLYDIEHIFDYKIYQKISKYLDKETRHFWDYLYQLSNYDGKTIYESNLVYKYNGEQQKIFQMDNYLTEENYLKLKELLPGEKINFIHCDISELKGKLINRYNAMFFSNINNYQKDTSYVNLIKKLGKHFLKPGGQIYFAYLYNYPSTRSLFFDNLLKSESYTSKIIDGTRKDKVYIYRR